MRTFFAWKVRHFVSFCNAKMTEMSDEDHMILSLTLGTKEGKIKSNITTLRNPTIKEIDNIARSEVYAANIKEQTSVNPNDRTYSAEGAIKKECNKCMDTSHLTTKCKKKLWCEPCKNDRHTFGALYCKNKDRERRGDDKNRRSPSRYGDRGRS